MKSLLEQYIEAKEGLTKFKKLESELRIELLSELFPNTVEGTMNTIDGDYAVKGGFSLNHSLNRKSLESIYDDLTEDEKGCIDFKPGLKLSAYKSLGSENRKLLDDCVSVSNSMPTITIKLLDGE